MKKVSFLLAILCLTLTIFEYGCKKNDSAASPLPDKLDEKVIAYLDDQMKHANSMDAKAIDSLKKNMDLSKLKIESAGDKTAVTYKLDSEKGITRKAVFYIENNGVKSAEITTVLPADGFDWSPANFFKLVVGDQTSFSGAIHYNRITSKPFAIFRFEKGVLKSRKQVTDKLKNGENTVETHGNGPIDTPQDCTAWYWVETTYYSDGSSETSWTYLYTECAGGGGDGGGGSGGGETAEQRACADEAEANAALLSAGMPTSGGASFTVSDIDALRKYKNPVWQCHSGGTWSLLSYESGIVKLVDPGANKWVWESLTHSSIALVGSTPGGTVEPNNGVGTPSFTAGTPNVIYASMFIDYLIKCTPKESAACKLLGIVLPPYTLHYTNHSQQWIANP